MSAMIRSSFPIRFVALNRLTKERTAWRWHSTPSSCPRCSKVGVSMGKIVQGDDHGVLRLASLLERVRKVTAKMSGLLAGGSPPDLILNQHCGECEFRDGCCQKALEKDGLSVLGGMSKCLPPDAFGSKMQKPELTL